MIHTKQKCELLQTFYFFLDKNSYKLLLVYKEKLKFLITEVLECSN